jgi:hypothetical protein
MDGNELAKYWANESENITKLLKELAAEGMK